MTTAKKAPSLIQKLAYELQPSRLIPTVAAGLLTGSLVVIIAISLATLAYAGKIDSHTGFAIGLALAGSAAGTLVVALTSSYPGTLSNAQDSPAAIVALMIGALVTQLDGSPDRIKFVTAVAAVMLATVLAGGTMFVLGTARLGRLVRFIPYPVIGGFLAGTGYLIVLGGMNVMTGLGLSPETAVAHFAPGMPLRWVPGVGLALVVLFLSRRYKHPLLLPGMVVTALIAYFIIMQVSGTTFDQATAMGLLVGPLPDGGIWQMPSPAEFAAVDWGLILGQSAQIATLVFLSVLQLLLNSSGIELVVKSDMDLNRELRSAGLANIAIGFFGGMPGYQSLSITLLGYWMRARSRLIGVVAAGVTLTALVVGGQFLSILPNAILGGFLVFLGLSLLVEWVYDAARRLPLPEYLIVIMIVVVIAARGYLDGVAVGIIAAVVLFLVQYSRQSVVKHAFTNVTYRSTVLRSAAEEAILKEHGGSILILKLQGYLFFGTANSVFELIKARIADTSQPKLHHVLLDFRRVTDLDTSAALSFSRMRQLADQYGFTLILTSLQPRAAKRLSALDDADGDSPSVRRFADFDRALEWSENALLAGEMPVEQEQLSLENMLARNMGSATATVITSYLKRIDVPKGEYLVRQGESAADLFFIESGVLSAQLELTAGQTVRVRTAKPGTVLGEIGFYLHTTRTASIVADEASVVYALSPEVLERMCDEAPVAAAAMHEYLAGILAERLSENTATLRDALD